MIYVCFIVVIYWGIAKKACHQETCLFYLPDPGCLTRFVQDARSLFTQQAYVYTSSRSLGGPKAKGPYLPCDLERYRCAETFFFPLLLLKNDRLPPRVVEFS